MVTVFTASALLWTNKGSAPLLTTNYTTFPSEMRPINTQVTKMHIRAHAHRFIRNVDADNKRLASFTVTGDEYIFLLHTYDMSYVTLEHSSLMSSVCSLVPGSVWLLSDTAEAQKSFVFFMHFHAYHT